MSHKNKKIVCETCKCEKDDNNKLKVICTNCDNEDDITISCESCSCTSLNDKKNITLKKCDCNGTIENEIYITCTEYEEDLD